MRSRRHAGLADVAKFVRFFRLSKNPVIAIVDDDRPVREALFDLLQVEGLSARTFENGGDFLADEAVDRFDCVITDVRMPGIDGLELQRRLRSRGSPTPVIFITSCVEDEIRVRALGDGAFAWFTKPVADEELLTSLTAALEGGATADNPKQSGN